MLNCSILTNVNPITKVTTIRTILALSMVHEWPLHHLDVCNVFLMIFYKKKCSWSNLLDIRMNNVHTMFASEDIVWPKLEAREWYHQLKPLLEKIIFWTIRSMCHYSHGGMMNTLSLFSCMLMMKLMKKLRHHRESHIGSVKLHRLCMLWIPFHVFRESIMLYWTWSISEVRKSLYQPA